MNKKISSQAKVIGAMRTEVGRRGGPARVSTTSLRAARGRSCSCGGVPGLGKTRCSRGLADDFGDVRRTVPARSDSGDVPPQLYPEPGVPTLAARCSSTCARRRYHPALAKTQQLLEVMQMRRSPSKRGACARAALHGARPAEPDRAGRTYALPEAQLEPVPHQVRIDYPRRSRRWHWCAMYRSQGRDSLTSSTWPIVSRDRLSLQTVAASVGGGRSWLLDPPLRATRSCSGVGRRRPRGGISLIRRRAPLALLEAATSSRPLREAHGLPHCSIASPFAGARLEARIPMRS